MFGSAPITQQPKSNSQLQQVVIKPPAPITQQPKSNSQLKQLIIKPSRPRQMMPTNNMMSPMMLMPMMPQIPGCPMGLEYLVGTSDLLVQQQIDALELMSNQNEFFRIEMPNKYNITSSYGQRIYLAAEQGVQGQGMGRAFTILILDFAGRPVLRMDRPHDFSYGECATCCNCCGRSGGRVTATFGDGSILGVVTQMPNGTQPLFHVCDNDRNIVAKILGPDGADGCCAGNGCCGSSVNFDVQMPNGTPCGRISKQWGGYAVEAYTNADTFGVSFSPDLDVRVKALLLAATFLIDFMFFEKTPDSPHRNNRNSRW